MQHLLQSYWQSAFRRWETGKAENVVEFYQMNCTVENTDEKLGINFQNYKEKLLVLLKNKWVTKIVFG